jgi:uncharacterized membrane protein YozB (DUF420 family)
MEISAVDEYIPILPHVNASLNALATLLLIAGYVLIRCGREKAHRRTMLACFCVSAFFLASYLAYHANTTAVNRFPTYPPAAVRYTYYCVLVTHIVLAGLVPLMAVVSIYLGLRDRRIAHRRWSRWTFPVWLYVSLTGVAVYLMLYHMFPPRSF